MRKKITIVICLTVGLLGGTGLGVFIGFGLTYPSLEQAEDNMDYWHDKYNDLAQDYNSLLADYADLFSDYNILQEAFEEPLEPYVIPTWTEVFSWVNYIDDTNEAEYIGNLWTCGDFAAMLMVRAKIMNWRMRIVIMTFSHSGELGWEMLSPIGEHEYVFNFIYVQDTIGGSDPDNLLDVYYINPTNDDTWVIMDSSNNYLHYDTYWKYSLGISSNYHWINYYNYFV